MTELRPYANPEPRGRAEYERENWGCGYAPHWNELDDATRAEWSGRRVDPTPEHPIPDGTYGGVTFTGCTLIGDPLPVFTDGTSIAEVNARLNALRQAQAALPPDWANLIEALQIMAKARSRDTKPLVCGHDVLYVAADAEALTHAALERLEEIGFSEDKENNGFYSYRYGSA